MKRFEKKATNCFYGFFLNLYKSRNFPPNIRKTAVDTNNPQNEVRSTEIFTKSESESRKLSIKDWPPIRNPSIVIILLIDKTNTHK